MVESQPTNSLDSAEQIAPPDPAVMGPPAEGAPRINGADHTPRSRCPQDPPTDTQAMEAMIGPILQSIEALARAQFEQAEVLGRVEKAMVGQGAIPRMLTETKQAIDQKNAVNRGMFEALHAELKSYKDGFLLESVLKPVIRDLIVLFDDVSEIHRQMTIALATHEKRGGLSGGELILFESVVSPLGRLEHNRDAILEVLERLDVARVPSNLGKLDKRNQRVVNVELVEDPALDQQVVKVIRCGFQWRERLIRPEEVIIKKLQDGNLAAVGAGSERM